jgi:hypothetical protein
VLSLAHVVFYISGVFWVRDDISVWVFFVLFFVLLLLAVKGVGDIVVGVMEVEGLRGVNDDVTGMEMADKKAAKKVVKADLRRLNCQLAVRGLCAIVSLTGFVYSINTFVRAHNYIAPVLNHCGVGAVNEAGIHHLEDVYLMLTAFGSLLIFVPSTVALIIGFVKRQRAARVLKKSSKG